MSNRSYYIWIQQLFILIDVESRRAIPILRSAESVPPLSELSGARPRGLGGNHNPTPLRVPHRVVFFGDDHAGKRCNLYIASDVPHSNS